MKHVRILAGAGAAIVVLALGTGCTGSERDAQAPSCTSTRPEPLVLVGQSVPTAERIPCITALPVGWKVGDVEVRDGRSSFRLATNGGPTTRLKVILEKDCVVSGATEVPTDEPGTLRWDRIPSPGETRMARTYTFPGGCVTYQFHLSRKTGGRVDEASLAVSFVTRAHIESLVRRS